MDIISYIWSFIVETATAVQYAYLMLPEGYVFSPGDSWKVNVGCAKLLTVVFYRLDPSFKITLLAIGKEDTWLLFIDQEF